MQSVNNNPIKSITINKSQCSNKNRIFKIQTSCVSVMYKHGSRARVHRFQAPAFCCSSVAGWWSDGQHAVTLYCQGEHLLLDFFCDFIDTLEAWFLFLCLFTSCGLFDANWEDFFLLILQYKVFGHLWNTFLWLGWALSYTTTRGINLLFLSPTNWPHTMQSCLESTCKFWGEEGEQGWRIRGDILSFIQLRKICFYWRT